MNLIAILAVSVMCVGVIPAYATEFELFVPDKMMSDFDYEGMIIFEEPQRGNVAISLASGSPGLTVPDSVVMKAGENHAIFPIKPESTVDVEVTVHAVTVHHSASAETMVYAYSERPTSLRISAPTDGEVVSTSLRTIPMKVFITDNHGRPVPSEHDTEVLLSASSEITLSRLQIPEKCHELSCHPDNWFSPLLEFVIPAGETSADFNVNVPGTGRIYALSDGLVSDDITIQHVNNPVTVNMEVLPIPAASHSSGTYVVWLERNGSIFIPDDSLEVELVSSDVDHVSFDIDKDSEFTNLQDGYATGEIMFGESTHPEFPVSVTANIEKYGSGSTEVAVVDSLVIDSRTGNVVITCSWVAPPVPSDTAWIVVASYGKHGTDEEPECADDVDDLESSEDDVEDGVETILSEDNRTRPINMVHVSSYDNLELGSQGQIRVNSSIGSSQQLAEITSVSATDAIIFHEPVQTNLPVVSVTIPFEITKHGSHTITSLQGANPTSIGFLSASEYGHNKIATIVPIPANIGENGDIAYLYVTDGTESIVDVISDDDKEDATVVHLGNTMTDVQLSKLWNSGVATVSGTYLEKTGMLQARVSGTHSSPTDMSVTGIPHSVEFWMPEKFNVGMSFPIAVHAVNEDGYPISKLPSELMEFSDPKFDIEEKGDLQRAFAPLLGNGTLSVITDDGYISESEYDGTVNSPEGEIEVTTPNPDIVRLGTEILLEVLTGAIPNPSIVLDSILDFEERDGIYVANPEEPGTYTVNVKVGKDGWESYTDSVSWQVDHIVGVTFQAISDDGVAVPISMKVIGDEDTEIQNGQARDVLAGVYVVEIPNIHSYSDNSNYTLETLRINDNSVSVAESFAHDFTDDSVIQAIYHREIKIDFEGLSFSEEAPEIEGNGQYRFGDRVVLVANPVPELFGLLWHVPDKWVGLPEDAILSGDTATFEAIESVTGHIEYSENYFVLIMVILSGTVAPLVIIRHKSPDAFLNLADALSKLKNIKPPKRKPKKEGRVPSKKLNIGKIGSMFSKKEEN